MESKKKLLNYFDVEKNIQIAINSGQTIRVISYSMSDDIEKKIDAIIENILVKYGQPDHKSFIYTVIKELAINGTKANLKRIFFEEKGLNIHDEKDYEAGMQQYKEVMTEEMAVIYGQKAREKGLYVKISFFHEPDGLRIEIINSTKMTPQEEKRLRDKLAKTMTYNDLMEFYMDNADNTEGAGMGMALIITLMKSSEIDPNLFRIMSQEESTIARIEIPFNKNYISFRDRGQNARKSEDE
ncbi:MAG TPA: histidine kinase [Spirochaetia bacterium]|nr:histidine kinase [Spirochaetia bacterium]